jgi:hypothetical protein
VLAPPPAPEDEGDEEDAAAAGDAAGEEGGGEHKVEEEEGGEGKVGEEEGEAQPRRRKKRGPPPPPPVNPLQRSLALCADTLGQRRPFTPEQVARMRRIASAVKAALERTELAIYAAEFEAARAEALMDEASAASVRDSTASLLACELQDASFRTFMLCDGSFLTLWPVHLVGFMCSLQPT